MRVLQHMQRTGRPMSRAQIRAELGITITNQINHAVQRGLLTVAGHPAVFYPTFSRSGHGFKHNVRLANCVGVIDSDYRGSVKVKLIADATPDDSPGLVIKPGDRVAQALVLPVPRVVFEEVAALSETERGAGGFGSTGA